MATWDDRDTSSSTQTQDQPSEQIESVVEQGKVELEQVMICRVRWVLMDVLTSQQ